MASSTEIIRALEPEEIRRAARRAAGVLSSGGLVVHPTETVYGIGGDGSERSNGLIAALKGRDADRPLILLTPDLDALGALVADIELTAAAERLGRGFWPGALTLVVRCKGAPRGLERDGGVAIRISSHPVVRALMEEWRRPMTSTSANPAGERPALTAEGAVDAVEAAEVAADFECIAIDGGESPGDEPSTIVSCLDREPRLLRPGRISREALAAVIPTMMRPD